MADSLGRKRNLADYFKPRLISVEGVKIILAIFFVFICLFIFFLLFFSSFYYLSGSRLQHLSRCLMQVSKYMRGK